MLEHEDLTKRIIGAAIEVHRKLGPGLLASLRLGESPDDVLDQHHGAIHDQPEVDGSEAHQVTARRSWFAASY